MFAVFGINFPVGVLVYWLTTNVWTMGQQMYVIHNNPTPGSKAQAAYLERLLKHVTHHQRAGRRRDRAIIKAIVAKGRERNEAERKFINGLTKAGLAAQADGSILPAEQVKEEEQESGGGTGGGAPRRQQPKRQSKAQRQSGGTQGQGGAKTSAGGATTTSTDKPASEEAGKQESQKGTGGGSAGRQGAKKDAPQDSTAPTKQQRARASSGNARQAKSGQRKGPQRPKHPSKK
jgi:YidC/Oxa1 family membrane protein insertase